MQFLKWCEKCAPDAQPNLQEHMREWFLLQMLKLWEIEWNVKSSRMNILQILLSLLFILPKNAALVTLDFRV